LVGVPHGEVDGGGNLGFTNVVARACWAISITEPEMNSVPVTVMSVEGEATVSPVGVTPVILGSSAAPAGPSSQSSFSTKFSLETNVDGITGPLG
jgi:hypothetical protein